MVSFLILHKLFKVLLSINHINLTFSKVKLAAEPEDIVHPQRKTNVFIQHCLYDKSNVADAALSDKGREDKL